MLYSVSVICTSIASCVVVIEVEVPPPSQAASNKIRSTLLTLQCIRCFIFILLLYKQNKGHDDFLDLLQKEERSPAKEQGHHTNETYNSYYNASIKKEAKGEGHSGKRCEGF